MVTLRNVVEGTDFDEIGASLELALGLASVSLKLHLLLDEANHQINAVGGERLARDEVGAVTSVFSDASKGVVGCGKAELAELGE